MFPHIWADAVDPSLPALGRLPATVVLRTVSGAEDLLIDEIGALSASRPRNALPGIVDLDPGPVACWAGLLDGLRDRRFYSGAAMRVDGTPGDPAVTDAVRALPAMSPADPRPDLGVDRPAQRIELAALHWPQRHHRLLRLPWSTAPVVGEVLVRLGKVGPGMRVLDPCCGSGTILITAALAGAADLIGTDRDHRSVATARANVASYSGVNPTAYVLARTRSRTRRDRRPITRSDR